MSESIKITQLDLITFNFLTAVAATYITTFTQTFSQVSHRQVVLTIEQFAMIDSHACHPANELEVGQVVLVT